MLTIHTTLQWYLRVVLRLCQPWFWLDDGKIKSMAVFTFSAVQQKKPCLCGVFWEDLLTTDTLTPISTKSWDKNKGDCSVKIYTQFARNLIVFNNKIGKLICIKSSWETTGLKLVLGYVILAVLDRPSYVLGRTDAPFPDSTLKLHKFEFGA